MTSEPRRAVSPLAEVELETLEEGREWTRQRLEKKLQRLAERQGAISPPQPPAVEGGQESAGDGSNGGRGGDDSGGVR
jgi:hypothetical protein